MKWGPAIHPSEPLLKGAATAALLLAGVSYFWYFLGRFSHLPGTDAYYYALQAQSLLETGHLKVPDNGVFYYAIAAIAYMGLPIETAFRIALTAVFALAILLLWSHASRLRVEMRLIAAAGIAAAAPVIAFHAVEFPRLTLGLALVPLWLRLTADARPLLKPAPWLALLGSAFLHPLVAVLAFLFGSVMLLAEWQAKHAGQGRRSAKAGVIALLAALTGAFLVLYWWPGVGTRVSSLWPGTPGLIALETDAGLPLDVKATTLLSWLLLAALSIRFVLKSRGRHRYLPVVVLTLAMWPNDGSGLTGLGARLALANLFITLPLALAILNERYARGVVQAMAHARFLRRGIAVLALAAILAFPYRIGNLGQVLVSDDYAQYAKVVDELQRRDIPMLIAHRGLDFYYTYRLRRDAFHFDPEVGWKRTDIWRVAARVTPEELAYYSPDGCSWGETATRISGTQLLLVREDCWEGFRARINPQENPDLHMEVWQNMENPSQLRPAFLREKYRHVAQGAFPAPSSPGGEHRGRVD